MPGAGSGTAALTGRARLAGLGHGVPAMAVAWLSAAMITLLTGAVAVVILLVIALVVGLWAGAAGWFAIRSAKVHELRTAALATAGDPLTWHVEAWAGKQTFLRVLVGPVGSNTVGHGPLFDGSSSFTGSAPPRGAYDRAHVTISSGGRLGLVWWRRTDILGIGELIVAPRVAGEAAAVERDSAGDEGDRALSLHLGRDEADGVRSWRDGDELSGVHWPSTLRTGEFVVRQRLREHDEQWIVPVRSGTPDPTMEAARARHSLEQGLAAGAHVAVQVDGAPPLWLPDGEAVLRWCAAFDLQPPPRALPWWRRPLLTSPEPSATVPRRTRWLTALATAITIVMVLQPLGYDTGQIGLVLLGTIGAAAITSWQRTSSRVVRQFAAVVAGLAIGAALIDLTAVDSVMASLRYLLPQMLVTLITVQGFECVDRRGVRVSLACAGILLAYAAGIRVDSELQQWMLAALVTIAAATALVTREDHEDPRPVSTQARGRWVTRARSAMALLGGVAVILGLLVVIPVPRGPAQLTLPNWLQDRRNVDSGGALAAPDGSLLLGGGTTARIGDATTGGMYPGFTSTLDTALRGDLGDTVVLRVRAPEPDFWRGQTFLTFDGRTWHIDADDEEGTGNRSDGVDHTLYPMDGDLRRTRGEDMTQTFYPQVDLPNLVFAAYRPTRLLLDAPVWQRPDGAIRAGVTLPAGSAYTVVSTRFNVTPTTLRLVENVADYEAPAKYLQVPDTTTDRTRELADQLALGAPTTYDYILAAQAWLAAHVQYSLDAPVPPEGHDAVDDFLFESQQGFCEQIATATVILLRLQGIPARLATGYVPSGRDPVTGVWISRASDAHAWVEVRFPNLGWVPFDPTADVPLAGESARTTIGADLLRGLSSFVGDHIALIAAISLLVGLAPVVMAVVRWWWRGRRRGRWGRMQDRFTTAAVRRGASPLGANARLADVFDPDAAATAHDLAARLDASAFSASWVDDDDAYERARHAVAVLERSPQPQRLPRDPADR